MKVFHGRVSFFYLRKIFPALALLPHLRAALGCLHSPERSTRHSKIQKTVTLVRQAFHLILVPFGCRRLLGKHMNLIKLRLLGDGRRGYRQIVKFSTAIAQQGEFNY